MKPLCAVDISDGYKTMSNSPVIITARSVASPLFMELLVSFGSSMVYVTNQYSFLNSIISAGDKK